MGVWMDGWMMVLLLIMDRYCVRVLLLVLLRSLMMMIIFIIININFGCYDLLFDDDISAQDARLMVQDSTHFYLCSGT